MINSMTGFGHFEYSQNSRKMIIEIKSVNHRYLDLNIKMPRKLGSFENNVREILKSKLSRGKVDVYINFEESADASYEIVYHPSLAKKYLDNLNQMADELHLQNDITVSRLSQYPDVFEMVEAESDLTSLWSMLEYTLNGALNEFLHNRQQEGMRLQEDLLSKVDDMSHLVDELEIQSPLILEEYKKRLHSKIDDLMEDHTILDSRIAAEITIYADKVCIDEEMVRLKSHVAEARTSLMTRENIGRKMDFLAQEMNREANTILSKSTDVKIADLGIELKTLIEKIREQIQNLE